VFDEIDHVALMDRIRQRIADKWVLALVEAFLDAGVMTASGEREDTWTGTPQGGILSPPSANIALSTLDEHFARQWNQTMSTWHQRDRRRRQGLGRGSWSGTPTTSSSLVNGQRHHAEALLVELAQVIAPLGLGLAMDKIRVVGINEGFDFLGFSHPHGCASGEPTNASSTRSRRRRRS
jgi:RNA-directed DNA polymerase